MADNCNERAAPTIEVPDIKDDETGMTKEEILSVLGYEEIGISKTDSEGDTITAYVAGRVENS